MSNRRTSVYEARWQSIGELMETGNPYLAWAENVYDTIAAQLTGTPNELNILTQLAIAHELCKLRLIMEKLTNELV